MIAALIGLILLFGAAGGQYGELMSQYVEEPVKTTLVDKDRRAAVLKELSTLADEIKELNKQVSNDYKKFEKLIKDYDSKPEDFDSLFSTAMGQGTTEVETIWRHRAIMLQHIQADEWQTIMSSANASMAKARK